MQHHRARLRDEHAELVQEHLDEREVAEQLEVRLSLEMRELREECQASGEGLGSLSTHLAGAQGMVAEELRGEAAVRAALGGELLSEESQRQALEAASHCEEAELVTRVEAFEEQLATMMESRASLEAHLEASRDLQAELRRAIAAERGGRADRVIAQEQALASESAQSSEEYRELRQSLVKGRGEHDAWKVNSAVRLQDLQEETAANSHEESALAARLADTRRVLARAQEDVRAAVSRSQLEVSELQLQHRWAEEQGEHCWDAARRLERSYRACSSLEVCAAEEAGEWCHRAMDSRNRYEVLADHSTELREELFHLRQELVQLEQDDDQQSILRKRGSRLKEELEMHTKFQEKLQVVKKKRSGLFAWLRGGQQTPRQPPAPPPPPPISSAESGLLGQKDASARSGSRAATAPAAVAGGAGGAGLGVRRSLPTQFDGGSATSMVRVSSDGSSSRAPDGGAIRHFARSSTTPPLPSASVSAGYATPLPSAPAVASGEANARRSSSSSAASSSLGYFGGDPAVRPSVGSWKEPFRDSDEV
jgi:hypothetical protein